MCVCCIEALIWVKRLRTESRATWTSGLSPLETGMCRESSLRINWYFVTRWTGFNRYAPRGNLWPARFWHSWNKKHVAYLIVRSRYAAKKTGLKYSTNWVLQSLLYSRPMGLYGFLQPIWGRGTITRGLYTAEFPDVGYIRNFLVYRGYIGKKRKKRSF